MQNSEHKPRLNSLINKPHTKAWEFVPKPFFIVLNKKTSRQTTVNFLIACREFDFGNQKFARGIPQP